jgi:hypothetical protein
VIPNGLAAQIQAIIRHVEGLVFSVKPTLKLMSIWLAGRGSFFSDFASEQEIHGGDLSENLALGSGG